MSFRIYSVLVLLSLSTLLMGQAGVNIRGGVGTMITDQTNFTAENGAHYGWRGAIFARIGASDSWFFDPGLAYERYNIDASSEFDAFEEHPQLHFIKGYINIATFLIRTDYFKLRLSGGGNMSYLARVDDNGLYDLDEFNDATLGVNGGLGIDIWFLTFDLGYEYAMTNFFNKKSPLFPEDDDLSNRFWTFSAGIFF